MFHNPLRQVCAAAAARTACSLAMSFFTSFQREFLLVEVLDYGEDHIVCCLSAHAATCTKNGNWEVPDLPHSTRYLARVSMAFSSPSAIPTRHSTSAPSGWGDCVDDS